MSKQIFTVIIAITLYNMQWIFAQPKYNICNDLGNTILFGIMENGGNEQWIQKTHFQDNVDWGLGYFYHTGIFNTTQDSIDTYYIVKRRADSIHNINAIPMVTFYKLLILANQYSYSGTEAEKVQAVLKNPTAMKQYFETLRLMVTILNSLPYTTICHVEPDSWGFMMWAFGIEGNNNPQSVEVKVGSSGHPDLVGFPDNASGFGQALLRLRDIYGPKVRMGWHASNFRVGTKAHIISGFYNGVNGANSGVGKWDVLVGEHPHMRSNGTNWWNNWEQALVDSNLNWFKHVSSTTGVPFILWQFPHGEMDYNIVGNNNSTTMVQKFAESGVRAFLFEHQNFQGDNNNDPYTWRPSGENGILPPAGNPAGEPRMSNTIVRMQNYTQNKYSYSCATTTSCVTINTNVSNVTPYSALISWNIVSGASSYTIQYRKSGSPSWITVTTNSNSKILNNLSPATTYEYQVTTGMCSSVINTFTTSNYCSSKGNISDLEFIDLVKIGSINKSSGNDGGYKNNTNLSTEIYLGDSYTIQYSASIQFILRNECWRIWIDYNRDGDFNDAGELVVSRTSGSSSILSSTFTVPQTANVGPTRMRISMKNGSSPSPCQTFAYGEVEDYTIILGPYFIYKNDKEEKNIPTTYGLEQNYPNPFNPTTIIKYQIPNNSYVTLKVYDVLGKEVATLVNEKLEAGNYTASLNASSFPSGVYFYKLCAGDFVEVKKMVLMK